MGNYHSTPNTLSAEAFGLTTEESKTLTSNVYPEVTFAFTNKTRGVLNGEDKSQTLHKATQGLLLDREGELPESYKVTDLWVTQDGLTLTEVAEANAKGHRADLLEMTDWWALSDRTMTAEQTAYRQALRDITTHANWPNLADSDWPTKPE